MNGQEVLLGNLAFMAQKDIRHCNPRQASCRTTAREGKTAIFLAVAGSPVGLIAAADTLKPRSSRVRGGPYRTWA